MRYPQKQKQPQSWLPHFYLKHVADDEVGVLWDGEPVVLQDLRGDPVTVDVGAHAVSPLDAEIERIHLDCDTDAPTDVVRNVRTGFCDLDRDA